MTDIERARDIARRHSARNYWTALALFGRTGILDAPGTRRAQILAEIVEIRRTTTPGAAQIELDWLADFLHDHRITHVQEDHQ